MMVWKSESKSKAGHFAKILTLFCEQDMIVARQSEDVL